MQADLCWLWKAVCGRIIGLTLDTPPKPRVTVSHASRCFNAVSSIHITNFKLASLQILQQLFTVFTGVNVNDVNNSTSVGVSNGTASGAVPPMTMPTDLSSLLAFLFSFSSLRDWLKLIVIGGVVETSRRLSVSAYYSLLEALWLTAYFDEDDYSYDWMMVWLSKQASWSKAREVQVSTRAFGRNDGAILVPGEEEDPSAMLSGSRKLAYLPSISSTYSIWYKRRWMTVSRVQSQTGYYGRREETLHISILTRDHKLLNEILLEAKKEYMAGQQNSISIYISDSAKNWRLVASRPKRPLRSIVLDPGIKDLLIDDARDFLESKNWYTERGIPFRRGYLLYGAPGSGKTSMIHSMAGELGLDVYVISLSRVGLDDTSLNEIISELPEKCIALMEDIDAAFQHTVNRDSSEPSNNDSSSSPPPPNQGGPPPTSSGSRVSLSGLLNALDGVGAQEGRILYATTNKYSALDPALCRPGRMDLHVEFKLASKYQAQELFRAFYHPSDDVDDDDESEKSSLDSGYSSSTLDRDSDILEPLDEKLIVPESPVEEPLVPIVTLKGKSRRPHAPPLSRSQVLVLARHFTQPLPEREFSMASLQGYLMSYKTRPFDAVREFGGWIERELAERAENQKSPGNATAAG